MMLSSSQASYNFNNQLSRAGWYKQALFLQGSLHLCVCHLHPEANFSHDPKWLPEQMAPFVHVGGRAEFKKDCFLCYAKEVSSFTLFGPPLNQSLVQRFALVWTH